MKKFLDTSPSLLKPADLVITFTKKKSEELALPGRTIITFDSGDLKRALNAKRHRLVEAWAPFRWIYRFDDSDTIITKSYFGGPNVAALVEELSAFGVKEFILWGYCGSISEELSVGDRLIAKGALREDGTSCHYLDDRSTFVFTDWFGSWENEARDQGIREGLVWSCDAIYRETRDKVKKYAGMAISAVEMEIASFYAVCTFKKLKGIAFLVVSDSLVDTKWQPGFSTKPFRQGARKMTEFIMAKVVQ